MRSCCLLVFLGHFGMANAQKPDNFIKRTTRNLFSPKGDTTRSAGFMILPAFGYAQETGVEAGAVGMYDFFVDRKNPDSRTSNIRSEIILTEKKQKKTKILTDIWTRGNAYHIISEFRYRDWPFNFYGMGNETRKADEELLEQQMARAKVEVEKRFAPRFYLGLNANFEYFRFRERNPGGIFERSALTGRTGGKHLALGISALYDSRNITTYTTKGFYARAKYAYAPGFWGGENFSGHQWEADIRGFHVPAGRLVLVAQALYRGTAGTDIPFYMHRELGGDMTMRGYYLGRYKDRSYATAQAEVRYRFMSRLGIAAFTGAGSTFSKQQAARFVPSYGAGLRYFFSLEHLSTIRFDYALGERRPGEQRQAGFYISASEAF